MNTDLQLLSRYHHTGEADAFRRLVEAHAGMVFATARRVTQDAALAEDIAQETFIELARRGRDVRDAVGAWLHRVAWRKAANLVRHDVMRQRYEPMAAEQWGTEGESTWEELEPAIDEALNELPVDQRETLIAHYLEGLTQQVLAQRLGISQSTVSRTLDAGIQERRSKLRAKGLLCGTGLAAMLSAHAVEAAPASFMTSLGKLALSGVGAGAATTGLALLLKTKAAAIIGVAAVTLLVAAAGYDLASSHSRLESWWNTASGMKQEASKPNQKPLVAEQRTSSPPASSAAAKAIWDAVPKFASADALDAMKRRVMFEQKPEAKLALLHQMGVRLSRAKLDRWLAEAQLPMHAYRIDAELLLQDYARTFNGLVAAWAEDDPLAALAWTVRQMPMTEVAENGYKWRTWDRTSRDVWDVLLAASKAATFDAASWSALIAGIEDPVTRARAGMVLQAVTTPEALLHRLDPKSDEDHVVADGGFICQLALNRHGKQGWPMVIAKLTSLNDQVGLSHVIGRALSDNDDPTLLPLMIQCLPPSSDFGNLLRACSGDSTASFEAAWKFNEAQREFTKAFSSKALKVDVEDNGSDFASELYMGWAKVDPRAAIHHALETDHKSDLETIISFMDKAHQTEAFLLDALGTMKPKQRDRYLCNLYEAQSTVMANGVADIDYRAFLQRVMHSETLQDQVVGAVNALSAWFVVKPKDAAAHAQEWLRGLPQGDERTELAMHIGESMGRIDPAAALQFARAESLTGDEAEFVCRTAMRQFAIGHSAEDCLPLLQQIPDDGAYAVAMNTIAAVKHGGDAAQAITFLKANARGDWQHDAMELLCDYDFNLRNPSISYSASAEAMLALPLAKLGPEVTDRMKRLAGYWARHQPVSVPLQWTTRLPADIAIATRQQLAKSLQNGATERNGATDDLLRDATPVFRTWVQTAPLSAVERNDLLALLKRIEDKGAKP